MNPFKIGDFGANLQCKMASNIFWLAEIQELGLWYLMPLSTIYQLYRGIHFFLWRYLENTEETTDLPHATDKLYHVMLYPVRLLMSGIRLTTLVVIGTDCIVLNLTTISGFQLDFIILRSNDLIHINSSGLLSWKALIR
jgi:hypothetical protein